MSSKDVTWGVVEDAAVFGFTELVEDLGRLRTAIEDATTWGEFRRQVSAERVREIEQRTQDSPPDETPFDGDTLPGYGEGDWPEWLHQDMLEWMPKDLASGFGTVSDSLLNGRFLAIDPDDGEDLARELDARGFSCRRDDELLSVATGYDEGF